MKWFIIAPALPQEEATTSTASMLQLKLLPPLIWRGIKEQRHSIPDNRPTHLLYRRPHSRPEEAVHPSGRS